MRKTEMWFGICAGGIGFALAISSFFSILPYTQATLSLFDEATIKNYAVICMAANAVGIFGALIVQKRNIMGAIIMSSCMIVIMFFGFPWQSLSAVMYIIAVVMATVPVRIAKNE